MKISNLYHLYKTCLLTCVTNPVATMMKLYAHIESKHFANSIKHVVDQRKKNLFTQSIYNDIDHIY